MKYKFVNALEIVRENFLKRNELALLKKKIVLFDKNVYQIISNTLKSNYFLKRNVCRLI